MSYRYQMTNTLCIFIFLQPLPLTIYLKLNFLPPPLHYFRFCTFGYHGIRNAKHSDTCTSINFFSILVESDESFSVSGVQGM